MDSFDPKVYCLKCWNGQTFKCWQHESYRSICGPKTSEGFALR